MKSGVKVVKDLSKRLVKSLDTLTGQDVLVGIPYTATRRDDDEINNAELAYIHENGAPEVNIPARPFLVPGIRDARAQITKYLGQAGRAAMAGNQSGVMQAFHAAGLKAVSSVKAKIGSNIPPELKPRTIKRRQRRGISRTNTLVDTGNLQNHINYVIREKAS